MTAQIKIRPVIMSGGAGTRLWPMSRGARPKQFLALASDKTLIQETLDRVRAEASSPFLPPLLIGAERHAQLMNDQATDIGVTLAGIVCEPAPRNTAAVAAVAAAWVEAAGAGDLVLLMPADHHIADAAGFRRAVIAAAPQAAAGRIVTFGVKPTEAHTGYGYIERGETLDGDVYAIKAFREKPDAATAQTYVAGGRHFWNAGIFLFSPRTMLAELQRLAPEIARGALQALESARVADGVIRLGKSEFEGCPSDSIDYAVMEKTDKAAVIAPVDVGWSDIGAWPSVEKAGDEANVIRVDAEGALIATDGPLVGVIGLDDVIVVATGDSVLVMPKSRAQDVKKVVDELKARGRGDLL